MDSKTISKVNGHKMKVRLNGKLYQVRAITKLYNKTKRLAIQYYTDEGEPFGMLTVNVPEMKILRDDEIIVRTTEECEALAKAALATGLFTDTGVKIKSGFIYLSIWRIN
jgi:hypothetical protein